MAEIPSHQTPTPAQSPPATDSDPVQYWCYQCDRRVSVETLENQPDVVCHECKNGFVEVMAAPSLPSRSSDQADGSSFNNQFLQVLRLIAQAARDEDDPPLPPSDNADPQDADDDYLRIELDGWDNDDDDEDDDDEEEDADDTANENGVRIVGEEEDQDGSDGENENHEGVGEEDMRRRRRELLRLRLRDLATRAASRRNRILDWAEILMGLEDQSIEIRLQAPDIDGYVGNPEDYVDAAGYEALLQNLAESDSGGRRGAPPAAKSAILALPDVEIKSEEECFACAICKDSVNVGDVVKKMPCEHGYHEDCIVPWLGSRNSCPVCRFELETEDAEYEEQRKKRTTTMVTAPAAAPSSSGS